MDTLCEYVEDVDGSIAYLYAFFDDIFSKRVLFGYAISSLGNKESAKEGARLSSLSGSIFYINKLPPIIKDSINAFNIKCINVLGQGIHNLLETEPEIRGLHIESWRI